jgi:hypothetical protein
MAKERELISRVKMEYMEQGAQAEMNKNAQDVKMHN